LLEEELSAWRDRPLGQYRYLFLDARYEKVRHGGTVISCAVLMAIGVNLRGHRSVLGCSVSLSEAEVHWREFLGNLQARGLHGVELIISDDHAGLRAALASRLSSVPWQRCQFHLQRNAMAFVPRLEMRAEVAADLRAIFDSPDQGEAERRLQLVAEKYKARAPRLSSWLEANVGEGLTVFTFPRSHWRRLRTSNLVERLSQEIKRRTRVAGLFPNEASLLRLVAAVLMEISEEWETEKIYLRMENENTAVAA